MRQYTSNYGSQKWISESWAFNSSHKFRHQIVLATKEREGEMRGGGGVICWWFGFFLWWEKPVYHGTHTAAYDRVITAQYKACQRSRFKCVSLKIISGHLSWTVIFQKQDLCWKKWSKVRRNEYWWWASMLTRDFQNRQEHNAWLCRFPDFSGPCNDLFYKDKNAGRIPPSLDSLFHINQVSQMVLYNLTLLRFISKTMRGNVVIKSWAIL